MSFQKEIPILLEEGLIEKETAEKLIKYYQDKEQSSSNRLFLVFGALGAVLIGLGVILILAHNWDDLTRTTKTILAFVPLLIGQILCGFSLWRKPNNAVWNECSAIILFFAVGASIALVSQIFNMPSELSSFLFTWAILCIPIIYLLGATISSLLYLIGITWYVMLTGFNRPVGDELYFWLLFIAIIPFYILRFKSKPNSNAVGLHNWFIPISVAIGASSFLYKNEFSAGILLCAVFGLLYLFGHSAPFKNFRLLKNGYKFTGAVGSVIVLLVYSFEWPWRALQKEEIELTELITSTAGLLTCFLILLCTAVLIYDTSRRSRFDWKPLYLVYIIFFILFFIGFSNSLFAQICVNILLLVIGVLTIREGAELNHLGILNYGMLIIAALVACRFFDGDLSFIFRGLLFVMVGIGFFGVNFWMLKKRRLDAE